MIAKFAIAGMALASAFGQTPTAFEVASVKVAVPGPWRESKTGVDRIDFPGVTLRSCLAFAYGLKEYQISGPGWLGELKYDIVAKGPAGTRREQLPGMMQALLAQRFQLQTHTETREFSVFTLAVGKNGPNLKESILEPGAEETGARFGMSMASAGVGRLEAKHTNMTALANTLARLVGAPVVDRTGLSGRYDLDLEYSPADATAMALPPTAESGVSVFESIQQFGLKLEARRLPLPAIVVDRAEKKPTEN